MQAATVGIEYFSTLGVGGVLAFGMFLYKRRDDQAYQKRIDELQSQRVEAEKAHAERVAEINKDSADRIKDAYQQLANVASDYRTIVQENTRAITALHGFLMRSVDEEKEG